MAHWGLLADRIAEELEGAATQGCVIRVYHRGEIVMDASIGLAYEYYDLASLTKIIFTTTALMKAISDKKLSLDSQIMDINGLSWFPHGEITLKELLSHCSGLPWWLNFYGNVDMSHTSIERRQDLRELLSNVSLDSSGKAIYSDVGFWFLGFVLEKVYQKPLVDIWKDLKQDLQLTDIDFHVDNKPFMSRNKYAPTQIKKKRGGVVRGEVDDDNCWAMGGVAPHAGLFGSLSAVGQWVEVLRSWYLGKNEKISQEVVQNFVSRQLSEVTGDWGLGFMKPTFGRASCGQYFSQDSFGHTGFTGTSIWYDPQKDVQVILLSNRVYPSDEPNRFKDLRPKIHDWIMEWIEKELVDKEKEE